MRTDKLQLEKAKYNQFLKEYKEQNGLRLGQSFYDYFKLYRMRERAELDFLYELDGEEAKNGIAQVFEFI